MAVLLDEALVEFADAQPVDASLALLEEYPRLLVFRSFSKAWGMAGLRIGYAVGGPGSEELLAELAPDLGVNELSQAGALEALRTALRLLARHVHAVAVERPRLIAALRRRGFEVTDSQANFLWVAHPTFEGGELAARLSRAGVLVAAGAALGEPRHVRISLRNSAASDRLLQRSTASCRGPPQLRRGTQLRDGVHLQRAAQPEDGAQPRCAEPPRRSSQHGY